MSVCYYLPSVRKAPVFTHLLRGTILDQVLEEYRSNPDPPEDQEEIERTLIVCGSDGVGKTTLIQKVTDTSEEVSPTVFIDYSFGVKKGTGESGEVGVCNTWELGSGAVFAPLLYRVPVGGQCRGCRPPGEDRVNQSNESDNSKTTGYADEREDNGSSKDGVERCLGEGVMGDELVSFLDDEEDEVLGPTSCGLAVVLMLDLSRPTTLWHTMRSVLSAISKYIASRPDSEHIRNRVLDSVDKAHPEFEPEQKRIICRCLRLVAHLSYGYLVFYSDLHNDLTKLALDILYHYGYGTNPP
ncbi:hypothetical protein AAG570_006232 [Ranatra chinensis]|uniref:Cytoplasmic dynein 2 light intermediate chain 1 n=1 Tax=Ranatra chinensis TaxID=642074 RepID=A0ABD0YTG7_9HEMI